MKLEWIIIAIAVVLLVEVGLYMNHKCGDQYRENKEYCENFCADNFGADTRFSHVSKWFSCDLQACECDDDRVIEYKGKVFKETTDILSTFKVVDK